MRIKILLFCFISFIAGLALGFIIPNIFINTESKLKVSYNKGWEDAIKRIEARGVLSATGNGNFYKDVVNGKITKIENNVLFVEIVPFEILTLPALDIRRIKVSKETNIIKTEKKSKAKYAGEVEEYYKKHPETKDAPFFLEDYPSMFYEIDASIGNLKVGQKITVKAVEDIVNKQMFTAQEISILYTD